MAWTAADQVSKAQRVFIEGIYDAYQHQPDFAKHIESVTEEVPTNFLGRQVSIEVSANPSLAFGNLDGGDFATPSNPQLNNFLLTYQWLNCGFEATYASILNNNKETVGDPFEKAVMSSAKQFMQWTNYYLSGGNGTTALATASANYSGGATTLFTCNGTADSFGATRTLPAQRGFIYDATGTTQRTGTVGAGVLTISSKTRTSITFTTPLPSDFVIGDIFVPEGGNQIGIKGIPYLNNNTGNYFNQSRTAVPQLQAQVIPVGGALTANVLLQLYGTVAQVAGLDDDGDTGWMTLAMGWSQWYNYMGLITPVSFQHYDTGRPSADIGSKSLMTTWFGVRMRKFFWWPGNRIDMMDMGDYKMAVLKKAGAIDSRMPAGDWVQAINGTTSNYKTSKQRWQDFAGDFYCRAPFRQGALTTLSMPNLMQKQVYPQ